MDIDRFLAYPALTMDFLKTLAREAQGKSRGNCVRVLQFDQFQRRISVRSRGKSRKVKSVPCGDVKLSLRLGNPRAPLYMVIAQTSMLRQNQPTHIKVSIKDSYAKMGESARIETVSANNLCHYIKFYLGEISPQDRLRTSDVFEQIRTAPLRKYQPEKDSLKTA